MDIQNPAARLRKWGKLYIHMYTILEDDLSTEKYTLTGLIAGITAEKLSHAESCSLFVSICIFRRISTITGYHTSHKGAAGKLFLPLSLAHAYKADRVFLRI